MRTFFLLLLLFASFSADAYVGPGLGLGVIGAIFGAIATVFMAIAGVIWYPIKRLIRKLKGTSADADNRKTTAERSDAKEPDRGTEQ
jgi:hypothetical protein